MPLLYQWIDQFSELHFAFVYILEAHAKDEWNINYPIQVNQAKFIEQRWDMVHEFVTQFDLSSRKNVSVLVDTLPNNDFQSYFHAWPLRVCIVDNELCLKWVSVPSDTGHFISSILYEELSKFN